MLGVPYRCVARPSRARLIAPIGALRSVARVEILGDLGRDTPLRDDLEAIGPPDDVLDRRVDVTDGDHEMRVMSADRLVLPLSQRQPFCAILVSALADDDETRGGVGRDRLETLVELPEERFVAGKSLVSRGHRSGVNQVWETSAFAIPRPILED
jgi:hypothetical protein